MFKIVEEVNGGKIKLEKFSVYTYTLMININEALDGGVQVVSLLLTIFIYVSYFLVWP